MCHHQYGKAERNFEFIGEDKDRQLKSLWKNTGIGDVLPWEDIADEAERLLEMRKASRDATKEDNSDGEQEKDQEVERDETDPHDEVIFGQRRPDRVPWTKGGGHCRAQCVHLGAATRS